MDDDDDDDDDDFQGPDVEPPYASNSPEFSASPSMSPSSTASSGVSPSASFSPSSSTSPSRSPSPSASPEDDADADVSKEPPPLSASEQDTTAKTSSDSSPAEQNGPGAKSGSDTTPQPNAQSPPAEVNHDVLDANVGDQPTGKDSLGFLPYVQAIASFLTNEVTKPPLTLSIEGEWGSGKSSFMLQLKEELKKETIISFNAWQYDKDDAMWAAFALESARQLSRQMPFHQRWLAHLELFFRRFRWDKGWMDMAKLALVLGVVLVALALPILALDQIKAGTLRTIVGAGGTFAYLALVFGLFLKAKDVLGNPLTINLKQHLDTPDYQTRVGFIQRFHQDFARLVKVYGRDQKVFVFIDDLDRCEVPKAADLMQALNLMISDSNRLIFIMGLDREKVAAGLAVKYEKLLPYLAPAPAGNGERTTATFDPVLGLEYGYGFIEKFIQLPFLVPQASETQIEEFFEKLFGSDDSRSHAQPSPPPRQARVAGLKAEKSVIEDSEMVTTILKMVAPALDYNPRRLKQFINTFRLKTFIASRTGLFGVPKDPEKYDRLTTQQLGKFVAISLRWPLLVTDLDNDRELLSKLQKMALDKISPGAVEDWGFEVTDALARWHNRNGLRQLLRSGCYVGDQLDDESLAVYGLGRLDVNKLLQVSPLIKPLNKELAANDASNVKPDLDTLDPDRRTTTWIDTSATYPKVIGKD